MLQTKVAEKKGLLDFDEREHEVGDIIQKGAGLREDRRSLMAEGGWLEELWRNRQTVQLDVEETDREKSREKGKERSSNPTGRKVRKR